MGLREDLLSGKCLPATLSYNDIRRIYGLPVYTSKWMPDTMIVMGNRGGKTMAQKGWEYAQKLADRQERKDPEVAATDNWHTYMSNNTAGTVSNTILYNGNWASDSAHTVYVDASVFGNPQKTFLYGEPLLRQEATLKEETPEAWLKRRVEEICWRPA